MLTRCPFSIIQEINLNLQTIFDRSKNYAMPRIIKFYLKVFCLSYTTCCIIFSVVFERVSWFILNELHGIIFYFPTLGMSEYLIPHACRATA